MAHSKQLTPALDLFSKSYNLVRKNPFMFLLLSSASIVTALIGAGQQISDHKVASSGWEGVASGALGADLNTGSIAGLGLFVVIFSVLQLVFMLMMLILSLRVSQGKTPDFDSIWTEFKTKGFKLFLLVICLALAIIAGFILLIVPGIILIWRLSMAPFIMIDKGTDISESFVQSWELTKGHAGAIYTILLVSLVLSLPNFVPYIGALVALGLGLAYTCALPLRYVELRKHS